MSKKVKIYTKTGDDGTTGLVGGSRVKKYDFRLEAYGTVDELNSWIGLLRSHHLPEDENTYLIQIQNKLFNIGSRLASDKKGNEFTLSLSVKEQDIVEIESAIDELEKNLPELRQFILPGGNTVVSQCHVARTVCRRAERRILEFSEHAPVEKEIIKYINRLSDFLFIMARKLAADNGFEETPWKH
ncbi:cob(I)yrinic acid a,c-diamide adenosyltransferase [Maribellus maritimus]|uniref:cob(I)yrinic acid a,c-diamide adenosyltransferase n=1 Tax=Maribellus maritimus TaxID=2870838 RepID=UPI001EEB1423|nr:cob(I)yrinic acid a,c-diamide adenosyltransferase [Maribellus maritimus]MCG6187816.1 cob(I)yrinic acid a,c-diamide adenosyltransferase [Maribellus maritimus]